MFAAATQTVKQFTRPLAIVYRNFGGECSGGLATFIVVNKDGWVLTAAHVTQVLKQRDADRSILAAYEELVAEGASPKQLRKARPKKDTLTHGFLAWGVDRWNVPTLEINGHQDLALGRIQNFNPGWVQSYPVFRDPARVLEQGTSLCKLGYPFSEVEVSFDEASGGFHLHTENLPLFPMDGIFTRRKVWVHENTGEKAHFIEMSSPGLRGQSGGPVYDVEGRVCGLQSHTDHLPLGFSPKLRIGGREVTEHQYLNIGQAANVEAILSFLDAHRVAYALG